MPDTSYTGIQVPAGTDGYSFEQILGALADSARVVIPAANATAAEQVVTDANAAGFAASAAAPLFVYRTDLRAMFVNPGTGWERLTAASGAGLVSAATGSVTVEHSASTRATATVTFPSGRFTTAPKVVVSGVTDEYAVVLAQSITSSGFTVVSRRQDGSTSGSHAVAWIALQMGA